MMITLTGTGGEREGEGRGEREGERGERRGERREGNKKKANMFFSSFFVLF